MVDQYRPFEKEARKTGKLMGLQGVIHPLFDPAIHVIDPYDPPEGIPTREWILKHSYLFEWIMVVDPHDRKPDVVIYVAMDKDHRKYVLDEWPDASRIPFHETTVRQKAYKNVIREDLIPKETTMFGLTQDRPKLIRIMDPRYGKNIAKRGEGLVGQTIAQEWGKYFKQGFITQIDDLFTVGRNALDNNLLLKSDNQPSIFFYKGFVDNCIYGLRAWQYKKLTGRSADVNAIAEVFASKNSDFPRCLHYLCVFDPIFRIANKELVGWRDRIQSGKTDENSSGRAQAYLGT